MGMGQLDTRAFLPSQHTQGPSQWVPSEHPASPIDMGLRRPARGVYGTIISPAASSLPA
jgi:hypothetical protein